MLGNFFFFLFEIRENDTVSSKFNYNVTIMTDGLMTDMEALFGRE
jgi:hypothetical protein